ncbi:MAG TPA: hypothetical protein VLY45_00320 [Nitrospiria bacterium]|nr:hypothetical protein [Nitrospiria bacterium]
MTGGETDLGPHRSTTVRPIRRLFLAACAAALGLAASGCPGTGEVAEGPSPFTMGLEKTLSTDLSVPSESPAVAWDGDEFLVVWSGRRASGADLFGVRIAPNGEPIDQTPRPVITAAGNQLHPSLVWGGDSYLVVWEDDRSGLSRVYGAHVSSKLEASEPNGFLLTTDQDEQSAPLATWTGSAFHVVWTESAGGADGLELYGTMVDPEVESTATHGMPLAVGTGDQFQPVVAWGPTGGLLVWSDNRTNGTDASLTDLYATRLDLHGRRVGPDNLLVTGASGSQTLPAVAWDGHQFDLAWMDQRQGSNLIYGARIDTAPTLSHALRDPGGVAITSGPSQNGPPVLVSLLDQFSPSLEGRVAGFWSESGREQQLVVGRVWTSGFEPMPKMTGPVAYVLAETVPRLQAAATGRGEILVVWEGALPGSGTTTQIIAKQLEVKE